MILNRDETLEILLEVDEDESMLDAFTGVVFIREGGRMVIEETFEGACGGDEALELMREMQRAGETASAYVR